MNTDDKFKEFMKGRSAELCSTIKQWYDETFLMSIVTKGLSEDVLSSIEEFLSGLPFEEAVKYVSETNNVGDHLIFYCTNISFLKLIIKYVLDINVCDRESNNALIKACACFEPNLESIKFFLDCGINVNAKNNMNMTALMHLCGRFSLCTKENVEQAIELLIFSGANLFIKSKWGDTAYDCIWDTHLLSERLSQLLQGTSKMNRTKRAT